MQDPLPSLSLKEQGYHFLFFFPKCKWFILVVILMIVIIMEKIQVTEKCKEESKSHSIPNTHS